MIFTVDDLCLEYLKNFVVFDKIKKEFPEFKLIAFAIGNFKNKEKLKESKDFKVWLENHPWVEIAVHSYDHVYPPDGDRDDEEYWIKKALESLKFCLPKKYGYRSAGWQTTNKTLPIIRKLGFDYIAFEDKINFLKEGRIERNIVNSHLYDLRSIQKIYEILQNSSTKK